MARTVDLVVETKTRGMWRVNLVRAVGCLVPRRGRVAFARWAVRRVTVEVRSGGRPWMRYNPGFDIEARS